MHKVHFKYCLVWPAKHNRNLLPRLFTVHIQTIFSLMFVSMFLFGRGRSQDLFVHIQTHCGLCVCVCVSRLLYLKEAIPYDVIFGDKLWHIKKFNCIVKGLIFVLKFAHCKKNCNVGYSKPSYVCLSFLILHTCMYIDIYTGRYLSNSCQIISFPFEHKGAARSQANVCRIVTAYHLGILRHGRTRNEEKGWNSSVQTEFCPKQFRSLCLRGTKEKCFIPGDSK